MGGGESTREGRRSVKSQRWGTRPWQAAAASIRVAVASGADGPLLEPCQIHRLTPLEQAQIQCHRQIRPDTGHSSASRVSTDTVQSSGLSHCASLHVYCLSSCFFLKKSIQRVSHSNMRLFFPAFAERGGVWQPHLIPLLSHPTRRHAQHFWAEHDQHTNFLQRLVSGALKSAVNGVASCYARKCFLHALSASSRSEWPETATVPPRRPTRMPAKLLCALP